MEHLFHVNEGFPVQVPLYADINDLRGNKDETSWDKARLKSHGDLQGHTPEEVARFFQSWLYFGFLHQFFEGLSDFNLLDFATRDGSGNHVITTSKLQYWLIEWFARTTRIHTVQHVQRDLYEAINSLFAEIHDAAILFCSVGRNAPYQGPVYKGVPEGLSLSILVLFSALEKAATQVTTRRFHYDLGNSRLLIRLLHQRNWCPTDVEWLSLRNIDTLYSACTMDRPSPQVQHDRCQPWQCVAFHVEDESRYEQVHTNDCLGCATRCVPIEELTVLIHNDQIPLVAFIESEERLRMTSVSHDSRDSQGQEIRFVALSHVWSDGLGNPTANALPVCQLRRLQRIMNEVINPSMPGTQVLWWCDTLCVPARGAADESRKRAIQAMRDVYKGAYQVLVLDQFLANHERDASAIQAYLYILSSRWMRRLWTFHEAVLARDILIQFKDGAAPLANLYYKMHDSKSPSLLYTWYDNDCVETMKPFVEGLGMEQSFNVAIYRAVAVRSTSRQSDETICLANVQGIEVKTILDIDEEDYDARMEEYFRLVRKLPVVLLFQRLPRLSTKGFRWAPTSLLTRFRQAPTSLIYTDHRDMVVSDAGGRISVQLPGVLLESSRAELSSGHHFGLILADSSGVESCFIVYYSPGEGFGDKEYPDNLGQLLVPGLILCYYPWSQRFETFDRAVLVNIADSQGDASFTADHVALVGLRHVPSTVFDAQFKKSSFFTVWRGAYLSESTSWLVS